jgi:hypothetical protein
MDLKKNKANFIINSFSNKPVYNKKKSDYFKWLENAEDYDIIQTRNLLMHNIHKIKSNLDTSVLNINDDSKNFDTKKNCVKKVFKRDSIEYKSYNQTMEEKKTDNNTTEEQISDCFKWLHKLDWKDKDELIMRRNRISSYGYDLNTIYITLLHLSNELYSSIKNITGAVDVMTEEQKYNFLFHVISKGKDMFYSILADPEFCLYMLDEYQPLYTYLREVLKY